MSDAIIGPRLEGLIISPAVSITEAIVRMDKAGIGALALCSGEGKLVGFLTDGDVRRAVLRKRPMEEPCSSISNPKPITAPVPIAPAEALHLMNRYDIHHLPVVDADGVLVDLILRRDLGLAIEAKPSAHERLECALIYPSTSISEAIAALDRAGTGALVLCTHDRILRGELSQRLFVIGLDYRETVGVLLGEDRSEHHHVAALEVRAPGHQHGGQ